MFNGCLIHIKNISLSPVAEILFYASAAALTQAADRIQNPFFWIKSPHKPPPELCSFSSL
jgi:hypothetical protein